MHNILITGGDHEDRVTYATQLSLRLLCEKPAHDQACESCANCLRVINHSHPNLIFVEPSPAANAKDDVTKTSSGVIKIDQIREIVLESNKANFEPGNCIFIITHMHRATKSAANALLKVMEETKRGKIFIALAPSRTAVLTTIASRMICRPVTPNMPSYQAKDEARQKQILAISKARLADRFSFCEQMSTERNVLLDELEALTHECHVMLRSKEFSPRFVLTLREALERAVNGVTTNLNSRLVIEKLILREWPLINR